MSADTTEHGYFHPVTTDVACRYCDNGITITGLRPAVDAIYCISLQEDQHRTTRASAHFHRLGLCTAVTFYRPRRGKNTHRAVWESHRAVARHALAQGYQRALILEDDVAFLRPWSSVAPRILRALSRLPENWWGFYLGHWPFQGYLIGKDIMRIRSGCSHAYIANTRLLQWLSTTIPMDPEVPMWTGKMIGCSVDAAMAFLPRMYAIFPMVAAQRRIPGDQRPPAWLNHTGGIRRLFDVERYRYFCLFNAYRFAEGLALLASPIHRFTLEHFRTGTRDPDAPGDTALSRVAKSIRQTGLFDDAFYLSHNHDVAEHEANALSHFLLYGASEGRKPNPIFDSRYYCSEYPDLAHLTENPLAHYIRIGAVERRNPHPLFDTAWYLSRHSDEIGSRQNPLAHFLTAGGVKGYAPHPLFDSSWYLRQNPDVAAASINPLVHYLTIGWAEGRAPHPHFDGQLYLTTNADVCDAGANPLEHYVRHGCKEGRAIWAPMITA